MIREWLSYPSARSLNVDDPQTTNQRRQIIKEKQFLHKIYLEWYRWVAAELPQDDGTYLEIGSGAGFLAEFIPEVLTSDVLDCKGIHARLSAFQLPFQNESLSGIILIDALHHLPQVEDFFHEAIRTLRPGGVILMIEPWVSPWSRFIYTKFHHEPFVPESPEWKFPAGGPLSAANGALPWMIFERDRSRFEKQFPQLKIALIEPMMPFRYLLSGGFSMRSLMPGFTFGFWRFAEAALQPGRWAMFARIKLTKI